MTATVVVQVRDFPAYLRLCMAVDDIGVGALADAVGVSHPSISHWRSGNAPPTAKNLKTLAACLPSMRHSVAQRLLRHRPLRVLDIVVSDE